MSELIVQAPNDILNKVAEPVTDFTQAQETIARLHEVMVAIESEERTAAGIAAPQIGESVRIFVIANMPGGFVNPEIIRRSVDEEIDEEGCLSLGPDVRVPVSRAKSVQMTYNNGHGPGHQKVITLEGFSARAAQHEIDHLDGILITDRRAS